MPAVDIRTDTELADVAKLFYGDGFPDITLERVGDKFTVDICGSRYSFDYCDKRYGIIPAEHRVGRLSKIAVYDALAAYTGRTMPWGALTGVAILRMYAPRKISIRSRRMYVRRVSRQSFACGYFE